MVKKKVCSLDIEQKNLIVDLNLRSVQRLDLLPPKVGLLPLSYSLTLPFSTSFAGLLALMCDVLSAYEGGLVP